MRNILATPTVTLPAIEARQLWRDEVDNLTIRTLYKREDGWYCRCIGAPGKVWYDVMPFECFATELTLVS